jgi:hypothetical protein
MAALGFSLTGLILAVKALCVSEFILSLPSVDGLDTARSKVCFRRGHFYFRPHGMANASEAGEEIPKEGEPTSGCYRLLDG